MSSLATLAGTPAPTLNLYPMKLFDDRFDFIDFAGTNYLNTHFKNKVF